MVHKIKKVDGTFYSDYIISNGECYAIFEHDSRVSYKFVCKTTKENKDWKTFKIRETKNYLFINLGE